MTEGPQVINRFDHEGARVEMIEALKAYIEFPHHKVTNRLYLWSSYCAKRERYLRMFNPALVPLREQLEKRSH